MNRYQLVKDNDRVEVLEGREARRDQLIAAGYEWVNQPAKGKAKSESAQQQDMRKGDK